jgi:translation initiation factor IF-3
LISADGNQVGVVPLRQALDIADEAGLDLVEVAPQVSPPVCRIMDYGRYKYQQSKKLQEARKKSAGYQIKEVKFRPSTGEHDFQVKVRKIKQFLEGGDKVKVSIMFRGRELAYTEKGLEMLRRIAENAIEFGVVEQHARREGRQMFMILAHK